MRLAAIVFVPTCSATTTRYERIDSIPKCRLRRDDVLVPLIQQAALEIQIMNAGGPAVAASGHSPPHDAGSSPIRGLAAVLHMARALRRPPHGIGPGCHRLWWIQLTPVPSDAHRNFDTIARRGGRSVSRPERGLRSHAARSRPTPDSPLCRQRIPIVLNCGRTMKGSRRLERSWFSILTFKKMELSCRRYQDRHIRARAELALGSNNPSGTRLWPMPAPDFLARGVMVALAAVKRRIGKPPWAAKNASVCRPPIPA